MSVKWLWKVSAWKHALEDRGSNQAGVREIYNVRKRAKGSEGIQKGHESFSEGT